MKTLDRGRERASCDDYEGAAGGFAGYPVELMLSRFTARRLPFTPENLTPTGPRAEIRLWTWADWDARIPDIEVVGHSQLTEAFAPLAPAYRVRAQRAPAVQLQELRAGVLDMRFTERLGFHRR
jgi:hypothetical protein